MAIISREKFRVAVDEYLTEVTRKFKTGFATEHTYRAPLEILLGKFDPDWNVINEHERTDIGAPDFNVMEGLLPKGIIECKDIGKNLDKAEDTDQFRRYLGFPNVILTDYLEFRWFVVGVFRPGATIATIDKKGTMAPDAKGIENLYKLLEQFRSRPVPKLRKPKDLALRMANLAKNMVLVIESVLKKENLEGALHQKLEGFRQVLIHDMTEEEFADMYTQTLAYGYFAARCNHKAKEAFDRYRAGNELPKTNPFLRELFRNLSEEDALKEEGIDWIVNELVDLLAEAEIENILLDFGKTSIHKDPVFHFYETFLAEYSPILRKKRAVYYTPEPVVSYIVKSVDLLLKNSFKLGDGLADSEKISYNNEEVHRVLILDPAVGTGTFLYSVIGQIYQAFKNNKGMWSSYVSEHLLPRVFGFELLMAPYAVAHMKLGLELQRLGYNFESNERLRVYLTNTLETATESSELPFAAWLSREANAARDVKVHKPVMVILGNPPYFGFSANASRKQILDAKTGKKKWVETSIGTLIKDYKMVDGKPLGEKNPKWLQDDYVKFIRFAQNKIDQVGYGILAFISSNGYLDNPTFRGMRQSLMNSFDEIYILDLHGSSKKNERVPVGKKDENVFEIQQSVAIGIFIKHEQKLKAGLKIRHKDLFGDQESKFQFLDKSDVESTKWKTIKPSAPLYLFIPQNETLKEEYEAFPSIRDIMRVNVLGFQSHRDDFAIGFDTEDIKARFTEFKDKNISDIEIAKSFDIADNRDWKISLARKEIQNDENWEKKIQSVSYRPFDTRGSYYSEVAMDYPRREIVDHVLNRDNLCLNLTRQTKLTEWRNALVSNLPTPALFVEVKDGSNVFPLYLYSEGMSSDISVRLEERFPNFSKEFLQSFSQRLGLAYSESAKKNSFNARDVFAYIYAVFYSNEYRKRYVDFLRMDFPRVPLTSNGKLFRKVVELGNRLIDLHLLKADVPKRIDFPVAGSDVVKFVKYFDPSSKSAKEQPSFIVEGTSKGRVYINAKQYFEGVSPEIWNSHIGGYRVAEKWLKDRKGRKLSNNDLDHYRKTCSALYETMDVMAEIDHTIDTNGGWPIS